MNKESDSRPDRLPTSGQPVDPAGLPEEIQAFFQARGGERLFAFWLNNGDEAIGYGLIGFQDTKEYMLGIHTFITIISLIRPILINFSFRRDFEKQIKLKVQEILVLEKRFGVAFDYSKLLFPSPEDDQPHGFTERVLQEIERSRSMILLGELAFGVAHQIRNPLNNLLAALHLIKAAQTPSNKKDDLFQSLTERVETINRLIREFISYTRIPKLNLIVESVNYVLSNTLHGFCAWMQMDGVNLKTDFASDLPDIQMDLYLMDQAFHNIVKNALEAFSGQGQLSVATRKLQIRHGPKPHLEFVKIIFEDTGPGMPAHQVDKVLRAFYSSKDEGMGLGMAVVDHIVRAHGGGVPLQPP